MIHAFFFFLHQIAKIPYERNRYVEEKLILRTDSHYKKRRASLLGLCYKDEDNFFFNKDTFIIAR